MIKDNAFKEIEYLINALIEKADTFQGLYLYGDPAQTNAFADHVLDTYSLSCHSALIQRHSGTSFAESFIASVVKGKAQTHAEQLCGCDLLLITDIEGLAGMEATMRQLYYILDKRLERRAPFIVTGKAPPSFIMELAPRLQTILEGLLIWRLTHGT